MQKHVNLVDLVKSFPTNIYLQNLASIQKRTSSVKFAHLAEKSLKGSISKLSTKIAAAWHEELRLPEQFVRMLCQQFVTPRCTLDPLGRNHREDFHALFVLLLGLGCK